jgi:hypothetical protein
MEYPDGGPSTSEMDSTDIFADSHDSVNKDYNGTIYSFINTR